MTEVASTSRLMACSEAVMEAAIRAGCRFYAGYPITPGIEGIEYMARRMPEVGGVFVQPESEIAVMAMVMGAAATGTRAMTSTSGPGIDLLQEGLSEMVMVDLGCVVLILSRGGPGSDMIGPSQMDYFALTKGGGHGGYHLIVLAPSTVQESIELMHLAFDLADKYRYPVIVLGDALLAHIMEPVDFDKLPPSQEPAKDWAVGHGRGTARLVTQAWTNNWEEGGLYNDFERVERRRLDKYKVMTEAEVRVSTLHTADATICVSAFGPVARIAAEAVRWAREAGIKAGLVRPITLWPFPATTYRQIADQAKAFLVVEMNNGQMLEDVERAVAGRAPVHFYGRQGGMVPTPGEVYDQIARLAKDGGDR